ncbi:hypothetical protein [Metabacillus malikii]|uniref:ABC-type multidrug transport system fused ATPase/permease subunit n=1 Tax=Metabacillus malikii TaxID=1504265 RepID=A0ABT9ZK49_9BACI|nr:hypothetical protein [Metabacillus malikii]MDQ0232666.1 ABC-type multidrug transport system fused ATPase/permease subunit [Metabacillus malikii]
MKDFLVGLISILVTVLIYEALTTLIGFTYNVFSDKFNFTSLLIDMGLFIIIFMPVYFAAKKIISKL